MPIRSALVAAGCLLVAVAFSSPFVLGDEPSREPKPVPLTRPEMKAALDRLKERSPRLPLPTAEEAGGERRTVNNGRMRNLYLPPELRSGGSSRDPDPKMSFDYAFSTMLFWITSRVNNCHYCLGHQENKLLSAGVSEDRIAALDGTWADFSPGERAAFAFTRTLTYEPHAVTDADLDALRPHFNDLQILEITLLVARYNATNRWTDGLGIPQEPHREFTTLTAERYRTSLSAIAPVQPGSRQGLAAPAVAAERPPLESPEDLSARLATARHRRARLPLVEASAVRELLADSSAGPIPDWMRLLANFPVYGTRWIQTIQAAEVHGTLSPRLKGVIAWTAARHDRAWYALSEAHQGLRRLGMSDEDIFALADSATASDAAEACAVAFARKLTVAPQLITDADVAGLREHFSDAAVAEIVYHVTQAAFFNRLTETAGLTAAPIDPAP